MPPHSTYSEASDEDKASLSPESQNRAESSASRRRSSRACDQCRRTKSKCERTASGSDTQPCRGCVSMGLSCTFAGPSHKRGPPKGYILALERRLHQVEALLGTVIASEDPRARSLLQDLSRDQLASQIIHRVNVGPFGPKGRVAHPFGSTKEDFLASILTGVSDEVLESGGVGQATPDPALISPTTGWQDNLQKLLVQGASGAMPVGAGALSLGMSGGTSIDTRSRRASFPLMSNRVASPPKSDAMSAGGVMLFGDAGMEHMDWDAVDGLERFENDTLDSEEAETKRSPSSVGMYLDKRQQLLVSNHVTGVRILEQCRQIIRGEPAKSIKWPVSSAEDTPVDTGTGMLPSGDRQELFIRSYFDVVHPIFPIIDSVSFMELYRQPLAKDSVPNDSSLERSYFRTLLLAVFSVTSRYLESSSAEDLRYASEATRLINALEGRVHPALCQALLLLGYRSIGVDSLEKAWAFTGRAIRMAQALGANLAVQDGRYAATGAMTFSSQSIPRIWAGCLFLDRYISTLLGRPLVTNLPNVSHPLTQLGSTDIQAKIDSKDVRTQEQRSDDVAILSCFNESCSLGAILASIMDELYLATSVPEVVIDRRRKQLLVKLSHWLASLPVQLRFEPSQTNVISPPYVLHLHLQYWWISTLLHRAIIRDRVPRSGVTYSPNSMMANAALAANRVWSLLALWGKQYSVKMASPFFGGFVLGAGVIDFLTMVSAPNDSAFSALRQNLSRMREMETTWLLARTVRQLLERCLPDVAKYPMVGPSSPSKTLRQKRSAGEVFEDEVEQLSQGAKKPMSGQIPLTSHYMKDTTGGCDALNGVLGLQAGFDVITSAPYPGYQYNNPSPQSQPYAARAAPGPGTLFNALNELSYSNSQY